MVSWNYYKPTVSFLHKNNKQLRILYVKLGLIFPRSYTYMH